MSTGRFPERRVDGTSTLARVETEPVIMRTSPTSAAGGSNGNRKVVHHLLTRHPPALRSDAHLLDRDDVHAQGLDHSEHVVQLLVVVEGPADHRLGGHLGEVL